METSERRSAAFTAAAARHVFILAASLALCIFSAGCPEPAGNGRGAAAETQLVHVSFDATRGLFREFNAAFTEHWLGKTGRRINILQSHGGSGKQARAVIAGLRADVVSLALAYDIDAIGQATGLIAPDWRAGLPFGSSPFYSVIVFVVRKGNPCGIRDWEDLARPDVAVITPNPKTSGGARWNYLAAWGAALRRTGDDVAARDFVKGLYGNVPVLDAGARAASLSFAKSGLGDVLIAWENEANLVLREFGEAGLEIVLPSCSILAEPVVAVVDGVAEQNGSADLARAYLEYLYGRKGQEIAAKNYFRPRDEDVALGYASATGGIDLFTIDEVFGGWQEAQKRHFADGGTFDQIYDPAGTH